MEKLLKQNYVKYGLIMTAGLVVCLAYMELSGNNLSFENHHPVFLFYQFIMPAIVWFLGLQAKKKLQKGKLTYQEGVKEGFKISVVFALTSPFIFLAYYLFVNPEIVNWVKTVYQMEDAADSTVIAIDLAAQIVTAVVFGTIYGAIISAFVRSRS